MAIVDRVVGRQHLPAEFSLKPTPDLGDCVRVCSGVFKGIQGTVMARPRFGRIILAVDVTQAGISLEIDESQIQII
jgi:hypothetical protein